MKFKIITRHTIAAGAAVMFCRSFGLDHIRRKPPELMETLAKLVALGKSPEPDDVEPLVGHQITVPECDCCGADGKDFVFELGEEPGLGEFEPFFHICRECVDILFCVAKDAP